MKNKLIFSGSLLMALAVILGALGAHALKAKLSTDQLLSFETGVRYHLIHALGILALAGFSEQFGEKRLRTIAILMVLGILFFSGSIYLLATRDLYGMSGELRFLGPVTPIGGMLFIAGWILTALSVKRN
ncbi:MAG TPA: DUF423 domain-containing protein [Flavobacteriales bacterium]|nr:DUF423 domain-containing protein [Flavobacteriales bacterium]HRE75029.1 DUF423 domain-containing protein [Flavobacteriales bacterium]HRJ35052.1 DUF423 domain-containing protein [Flavobacteriales bacterium]HRJ39852.1 DUF423 domain-containing protein [Flavobacteriales bacterium]